MNLKRIALVFTMVLALALVGCGQQGSGATKEGAEIPGLAYQVPENWEQGNITNLNFGPQSAFSAGYRMNKTGGVAVLNYGENTENMRPKEMAQSILNTVPGEQVKESKITELKVDGKEAARLAVTANNGEADMYIEITLIEFKNTMVMLTMRDTEENKNAVISGAKVVLDSLKIDEPFAEELQNGSEQPGESTQETQEQTGESTQAPTETTVAPTE